MGVCAGCAVGCGVLVGLDVEEVGRRPRNMMLLAKRRFSQMEHAMLAGVKAQAYAGSGMWCTCMGWACGAHV